ncbi:MAG: aminotransferase class I/II-fold pyridoxal phosphate-dependent enzyme, partial [Alistipes sp.]|nr:aminotransferase class I/II-fold pyridoxal phosphate-dependent enzyme [Alistipes sp.]
HASLIDGLKLCDASWQRFVHNDMEHLERLLQRHRAAYRKVWIVTESIFSMDGDRAPLRRIAELKRQYDACLYVDEAHAFGVCGPNGTGVAAEEGVASACDVRIATFGKALASAGAMVITDALTHDYLVNKMRPLIFSTALPPITLRWSEALVRQLPQMESRREALRDFAAILTGDRTHSQIIPIQVGENHRAIALSRRFREAGYWVMPIRTPTVPPGTARIRVSLSAALTREEVVRFHQTVQQLCSTIG